MWNSIKGILTTIIALVALFFIGSRIKQTKKAADIQEGKLKNLRFKEIRLFGNPSSLPPPYIRVYLGQCNLFSKHDKQIIICYPIIKLFESGILLVEFRTISPNSKISLEDFISRHINLYTETFKKIEVPPAVAKYATYAYYQYIEKNLPFHLRVGVVCLRKQHELAVDKSTKESEEGDFVIENDGVSMMIDPMSFPYLMGSVVNYKEDLQGSRFIIENPNAKVTCGCGSSFSI